MTTRAPDTTRGPEAPAEDLAQPREFARWNERMVERYDIEAYYEKSHPLVRWVERRRLRALRELAAPRPTDRVLEVGCGAGHVLETFDGQHRVGVDLSASMLRRARRRLGESARLTRATAEALPFEDGQFDIVICTEVLEHSFDPAAVIAELVRVAGANGRVVVSIPNEANIDRAKRVLRRVPGVRRVLRRLAAEGNEWHLHAFDLARLRGAIGGMARIAQLRGVPAPFAPIRYVALLQQTPEVSA